MYHIYFETTEMSQYNIGFLLWKMMFFGVSFSIKTWLYSAWCLWPRNLYLHLRLYLLFLAWAKLFLTQFHLPAYLQFLSQRKWVNAFMHEQDVVRIIWTLNILTRLSEDCFELSVIILISKATIIRKLHSLCEAWFKKITECVNNKLEIWQHNFRIITNK